MLSIWLSKWFAFDSRCFMMTLLSTETSFQGFASGCFCTMEKLLRCCLCKGYGSI